MTSERFQINKSTIIEDAYILEDKNKKYTFTTLKNKEDLYSFCKALNELQDKNKWLEFSLVNDHKILKDFIDICNRVQYEVLYNMDDDEELVKLAGIIRDMLQNMNVGLLKKC